jgi:hypothetical protein
MFCWVKNARPAKLTFREVMYRVAKAQEHSFCYNINQRVAACSQRIQQLWGRVILQQRKSLRNAVSSQRASKTENHTIVPTRFNIINPSDVPTNEHTITYFETWWITFKHLCHEIKLTNYTKLTIHAYTRARAHACTHMHTYTRAHVPHVKVGWSRHWHRELLVGWPHNRRFHC